MSLITDLAEIDNTISTVQKGLDDLQTSRAAKAAQIAAANIHASFLAPLENMFADVESGALNDIQVFKNGVASIKNDVLRSLRLID